MTAKILPTRNTEWGFWGTIARNENSAAEPAKVWEIASRRIGETTGASPEGVRDFLGCPASALMGQFRVIE